MVFSLEIYENLHAKNERTVIPKTLTTFGNTIANDRFIFYKLNKESHISVRTKIIYCNLKSV